MTDIQFTDGLEELYALPDDGKMTEAQLEHLGIDPAETAEMTREQENLYVQSVLAERKREADAPSERWQTVSGWSEPQWDGSPVAFLASPRSHADPVVVDSRVGRSQMAEVALSQNGVRVYNPLRYSEHPPLAPSDDAEGYWRSHASAMLRACDALVVLIDDDGWAESVGVRAEIALAERLNKQVVFWCAFPDDKAWLGHGNVADAISECASQFVFVMGDMKLPILKETADGLPQLVRELKDAN